MRRSLAAFAALAALGPLSRLALADIPPATLPPPPAAPPPGWEAPPPLPPQPAGSAAKKAAACCRYDQACCVIQGEIDAATPPHVVRSLPVALADLPRSQVKQAPRESPGIEGAPPLRLVDDQGRPPPFASGYEGDVRIMPPGRFGELTIKDDQEPFFLDDACKGQGHGLLRTLSNRHGQLNGKVDFLSLSQGAAGKLVVDKERGLLSGKPQMAAIFWSHAEATPLIDGTLFGYRGALFDDKAEAPDPGDWALFVLPEVIRFFEGQGSKLRGGFFPSRFSRSEAFSEYAFPLGPGKASMAMFTLRDTRCWFSRMEALAKAPFRVPMALSVSQTAAEPEPKLRVLIYEQER